MQPTPFVSVLVELMMVVAAAPTVLVVVTHSKYPIRSLAVGVAARSLAKDPYLCCSDCVVDTIEVKLILDRQPRQPLHSDCCRTFVNAVWRVRRMPLHPGQLIATANYRHTAGTAHSYVVREATHQLDL